MPCVMCIGSFLLTGHSRPVEINLALSRNFVGANHYRFLFNYLFKNLAQIAAGSRNSPSSATVCLRGKCVLSSPELVWFSTEFPRCSRWIRLHDSLGDLNSILGSSWDARSQLFYGCSLVRVPKGLGFPMLIVGHRTLNFTKKKIATCALYHHTKMRSKWDISICIFYAKCLIWTKTSIWAFRVCHYGDGSSLLDMRFDPGLWDPLVKTVAICLSVSFVLRQRWCAMV